jgi:hypothetical protein
MRDPNQLNPPTGQGQRLTGLRRAAIIFLAAIGSGTGNPNMAIQTTGYSEYRERLK